MNDSTIWIETFTGKSVNPLKLTEKDIYIEDIAHALSLMCRFNGHCREFYSVAEHSIRVSRLVSPENKLKALLHDATEAYFSDVTRPVKLAIPKIKKIEKIIEDVIASKFNLVGNDEVIKKTDNILLATEARDLMTSGGKYYHLSEKPLDFIIEPWPIEFAEESFLSIFYMLTKEQKRRQNQNINRLRISKNKNTLLY